MKECKLALLGYGNVGRAFTNLLSSKARELEHRYHFSFKLMGIATGSHGSIINEQGIAFNAAQSAEVMSSIANGLYPSSVDAFIEQCQADVLVETIPVNYANGEPALSYLHHALKLKMHVVSANKGPVVFGYRSLLENARLNNRNYLFESAVMDGAPIFSMWREALPGLNLLAFNGVLNSTTNFILNRVELGESFPEAIQSAQAIGIAETDPRGDVEGWDAAIKVAALNTVLMEIPTTPQEIHRIGIADLTESQIRSAVEEGSRWKLICRTTRLGDQAQSSVKPEMVSADHLLYHVNGTSSAITLKSDMLGDLTLVEDNPSPLTTAYGMLADILTIIRQDEKLD